MAAVTTGAPRTTDLGLRGPAPARTTGPAATDRSPAAARQGRTVRPWPLLVLAAPAAAEVWSGWVGIARLTGFGLVSPLPGIWPSLHLDTSITLPVGVEAYAAYALRAWLSGEHSISGRTRRFAKWSAICSFVLGMAGQVAYHLLAQAGTARAPWPVTMIVSCLPVLVLAMGTTLAHMLRADAGTAADGPDNGTGGLAVSRPPAWSAEDQAGAARDRALPQAPRAGSDPPARTTTAPQDHSTRPTTAVPPGIGQARLAARRLAAAGRPVSRRALRSEGIKGSNQALNDLARTINAELAGTVLRAAFLFIRLVYLFMVRMFGSLVLLDGATRTRRDIGHTKACGKNSAATRPRGRRHCPDRAQACSVRSYQRLPQSGLAGAKRQVSASEQVSDTGRTAGLNHWNPVMVVHRFAREAGKGCKTRQSRQGDRA